MQTLQDVLTAIANGAADDNLDAVFAAVKNRRTEVARIQAATLEPGDEVELTSIRPAYLKGLHAIVDTRPSGNRVKATIIEQHRGLAGRFAEAGSVAFHIGSVQKVAADKALAKAS